MSGLRGLLEERLAWLGPDRDQAVGDVLDVLEEME